MRAVVNGLMYILSTGCQWRYLPKDFPPHSTVYINQSISRFTFMRRI
jgi:transposase